MLKRTKTPYNDINGVPIYTGDIIKHYNDLEVPSSYDLGIVYEQANEFHRTTLLPSKSFELSDKCYYLVLGDMDDPPVLIAVELWKTLHSEQQENYYNDAGIIGFLEEFRIPPNNDLLTTQEIEWALDEIEKYNHSLQLID